jgi:hypothetical protein
MVTPAEDMKSVSFRKCENGEYAWNDFKEQIFKVDHSHKCSIYVHRTPPCQGSYPSGEGICG